MVLRAASRSRGTLRVRLRSGIGQRLSRIRDVAIPLALLLGLLIYWGFLALFGLGMVISVAFMTPYPRTVLTLLGLGAVAYKLSQRVRRQRREARFWLALAAVGDRSPDAAAGVQALLLEPDPTADVLLLAAAEAAWTERHADALDAVERARPWAASLGIGSGGLKLRFPGLPGVVSFDEGSSREVALDTVRAHLLVRSGRAAEVLAEQPRIPDVPLSPLMLVVVGDAWMFTGDFREAARAYGDAAAAFPPGTPEASEIGFRLAEAQEKIEQLQQEAESLVDIGDDSEADALAEMGS